MAITVRDLTRELALGQQKVDPRRRQSAQHVD
jgi:hypothetical protein